MKDLNKWKKQSASDKVFDIITRFILILLVLLCTYPVYFVLVASFTDPDYVNSGAFIFYPKGFNIIGYEKVIQDKSIWSGYLNTIIYTVCGSIFGMIVTIMAGFALTRKELVARGILSKLFVFTMYFSGGMIPFYLVIRNLNLIDTRLVMILVGSVSVYNMIIVRSFMESSIPEELFEAAKLDGCGYVSYFSKVVVPLSKAVIAIIILYIAVTHWNSYFNAMILLQSKSKHPLQLILRRLLLTTSIASQAVDIGDPSALERAQKLVGVMKYSVIVVSTVPILCAYPFVQKYFVKGVMIGSIKG